MAQNIDYTPLMKKQSRDAQQIRPIEKANSLQRLWWKLAVSVVGVFVSFVLTFGYEGAFHDEVSITAALSLIACLVFIYELSNQLVNKMRQARVYAFTQKNGMRIITNVNNPEYNGSFFSKGWNKKVREAVIVDGKYEIGSYTFRREGRAALEIIGYIRLKLPRSLPYAVLNDRSIGHIRMVDSVNPTVDRNQYVSVGDYDAQFRLYTPNETASTALSVFNPDVMRAILSYGKIINVEIMHDELVFVGAYGFGFRVDSPEELKNFIELTDFIYDNLQASLK